MKTYDKSKWEKVELGKVGSIITGSTPSRDNPEFWGGDFCWVTAVDFQSKYIFTSEEKLSDQGKKVCRVLPPNTVLVTCIASIGLNAITKCESATNQQINAIVCDTKFYDPEFIYYAIEAYKFNLINLASKTAVPIINKTQFERFCIAVPDLKEQNKIAETLSNIDSHIFNLEKLISKQENIKKSTINLLLKPNKDWETVKIKDVFTVTRGLVLSTTEMSKHKTDKTPFPVYSSQTQNNGLIGFYSAFLYQDAITWTTDGANAGFVRFRPGKFYCTNVCGVLLSEKGHANACIATILGSVSKKYVSYVGNPKLMNNVMAEIPISIPPIDQQKQIAQKLGAIDEHISNLKLQLKKQQDLKQGLMQYFFGD